MTNIVMRESWSVLGQMAPYLLFGFLVAGVLSVCISPEFVERHLGGRGFGPVLKAALFGVPLPLCSCGVIPVSASFRRHGASRAATTSFLLSTPQTGVDSIAVTYALLGLVFAVFRPDRRAGHGAARRTAGDAVRPVERTAARRRGEAAANAPRAAAPARDGGTWCGGRWSTASSSCRATSASPCWSAWSSPARSAPWCRPTKWQPYLGGGILSILLMMALGIPLYVCASASVPIAAGLIHLGASPGAALAFLIAGPATNAATITTVWKLLGGRTAILYLLTIAISAVGGGLTARLAHANDGCDNAARQHARPRSDGRRLGVPCLGDRAASGAGVFPTP